MKKKNLAKEPVDHIESHLDLLLLCMVKVKLHIQNIHSGNANFVSFIDYLTGRRSGFYFPGLFPKYQRKNDYKRKTIDYTSIMKEELLRQYIRQKRGVSSLLLYIS
jgi:hypothetical protein